MAEDRPKKRGVYLRVGRVICGHKICSKCGERKQIRYFYRDRSQSNGIQPYCKKCSNDMTYRWRKGKGKNISFRSRQHNDWKKRGIDFTVEEYQKQFEQQKGCCAICGEHQSQIRFRLGVDHNHKTGQIRGLLCGKCNFVVAALESNGDKIQSSQEYLEKWRKG